MKKISLLVVSIAIVIGFFLRVYNIDTNYYFSGELGKELLYIRQFATTNTIPWVGMATSHPWLSYGPIYYWKMIPIFNLFNGNPFILFWTAVFVAISGLVLNYLVFKKIAGGKVAVISTIFQAISPLFIWQTRLSKLHVFFWVIIPIFTYLMYLLWNGKKRWVFWTGLVFGTLFSFHFSQIPLLGVVIFLFWIKRDIYKISDWIKFGLGVLIPNITFIWQDKSLALWLPYRIVNTANKNPIETMQSLVEYFGRNLFWDKGLWIFGLAIFLIIFTHYIYKNKDKFTKDFLPFYLISSITLMLVANILHGTPPVHYFLPIFTILPILYAIYLEKNIRLSVVLLALIFILNFNSYFKFESPDDFVPYAKQIETADALIKKANGQEFSIKRIGPYDYFPENYSQNYKYLILWRGGKLTENSSLIYTIDDTK